MGDIGFMSILDDGRKYFLTTNDLIDYHNLPKGTKELDQKCFLMSRFFQVSLDDIKKLPWEVATPLGRELEKYLAECEKEKVSLDDAISLIKDKMDNTVIENRFDILDL